MIDTQEKLDSLVKETIKEANNRCKHFELYVESNNLYMNSFCQMKECLFTTENLKSDFLAYFCNENSSLIGGCLFNDIISQCRLENRVKKIDYFDDTTTEEIKKLNPQYYLGMICDTDIISSNFDDIKSIKGLYEPIYKEAYCDYVVFIKDKDSASISFEFANQSMAKFIPMIMHEEDEQMNIAFLSDEYIQAASNDAEYLKRANTRYCNLFYYFNWISHFDKSEILVYQINRSTRPKRKKHEVISVKIINK